MRVIFFVATLSLSALLTGCSAEPPRARAPHAERNTVDPSIPAVTITARRMTDAEKLAYDHSLAVKLAGLPAGN